MNACTIECPRRFFADIVTHPGNNSLLSFQKSHLILSIRLQTQQQRVPIGKTSDKQTSRVNHLNLMGVSLSCRLARTQHGLSCLDFSDPYSSCELNAAPTITDILMSIEVWVRL